MSTKPVRRAGGKISPKPAPPPTDAEVRELVTAWLAGKGHARPKELIVSVHNGTGVSEADFMLVGPAPARPARFTAKDRAEVNELIAGMKLKEKRVADAREAASRWWGSVAGIMCRLWDDVQELEEEVGREGSPLAGFIDRENLRALTLAVERANNAAMAGPPCLPDIPRPVKEGGAR